MSLGKRRVIKDHTNIVITCQLVLQINGTKYVSRQKMTICKYIFRKVVRSSSGNFFVLSLYCSCLFFFNCCWNWRDRWDWLATLSMLMMKVQSDDSDLQTGVLTVGHHCLLLFISQPDKCMGICYRSFRKLFVRTRSTLIVSNLNAMKKTEWLTDFNHDEKALLASWLSILDLRRNCYSSDSSVFRSWSLLLCYSESESSTSICLENHLDMYW